MSRLRFISLHTELLSVVWLIVCLLIYMNFDVVFDVINFLWCL